MHNINKATGKTINFAIKIFISLLFCQNISSQSITWQKLYNGPNNTQDICKDLCEAGNGNFFAVGSSKKPIFPGGYYIYVIKINTFGDTLWSKLIDSVSNDAITCTSTSEGGVVIAGEGHFALKLDSSGYIVWKKFYNESMVRINDIIKTSEGGFLACGEIINLKNSILHYDGYIMKLDNNGNMLWDTILVTVDIKELHSIVEYNDHYYFTGINSDFTGDTGKCLILKTNLNGSVIWEKKYKVFNNGATGIVIKKIQNGFLISGTTSDTTLQHGNAYIMKIDSNGNNNYTKIINSIQNEQLYDINILNSNKYVLTVYKDIAKNYIVDSTGLIISEKQYYTDYYSIFFSILPLNNGDILFGGTGRFFGFEEDVFIARTDSMLNSTPIGLIQIYTELKYHNVLLQNYPNPFNPFTKIMFDIPIDAEVSLKVFDIVGREVFSLDEFKQAGSYEVMFDGSNLASGMYFYSLKAETSQRDVFTETKKMVLLK